MKITGYNSVVAPGNTANATVKAVGDLNAYGGDGSGFKAASVALGKVQQAYEYVAEQEDKRALMSAMDIYDKGRYDILYNDENGVLNTKLEGAAGSVDSYVEREAKLRNEILGNLKFKTEKYKLAFQDMANKSARQGYELVDKHQYKQLEAQQDLTLNNNLENALQFAQKNYGNNDAVMESVANGRLMISARYGDRGQEFVEKINQQFEGKMGEMLINQAVMRGEYDRAEEIKTAFDGAFSADQLAKLDKLIYTKQQDDFEMKLAEDLQRRYGEDIGGAMAELENTNAFGSDRAMNLRERTTVLNMVQSINNTNKAIETARIDKIFTDGNETIKELKSKNYNWEQAMAWAKEQAGTDTKALSVLQTAVNAVYGTGKGISISNWNAVDDMLRDGQFNNAQEYIGYLTANGASEKQLEQAKQNYENFRRGIGDYAFNFKDLQASVMGKAKLNEKEKAKWDGTVAATREEIASFAAQHKRPPTNGEVIKMLENNMTKGIRYEVKTNPIWWKTIQATNAELAMIGARTIEQQDNDTFIIQYFDGKTQTVSREEAMELVERAKGEF